MFDRLKERKLQRRRRVLRVRKKISSRKSALSEPRLRLCVLKTNLHLYAQIIDDVQSHTLVAVSTLSKEFRGTPFCKKSKEAAREIGKRLASLAKGKEIERVIFDRRRFKYHGLIAELAEGAREGGLQF